MTRETGFHLPPLIPALQYFASFAIVVSAGFAALTSGGWSAPAPSTQVARPLARDVNLPPERSSPEMVFYLVSSEAEAGLAHVLEAHAESANSSSLDPTQRTAFIYRILTSEQETAALEKISDHMRDAGGVVSRIVDLRGMEAINTPR